MEQANYQAQSPSTEVVILGGGLAGCECAWQLAERGFRVVIFEQRPGRSSPAHQSAELAELVCSNSLRGASVTNAVGVLKEELRRLGSLIMKAADATRLPAGGALAVDREKFAAMITKLVSDHPRIQVRREAVDRIPEHRPCVIATGPLTSDALAEDLRAKIGAESLSYFDAISPVIDAETIDWDKVFRQSRFDKADMGGDQDKAAYVNCPFDKEPYFEFVRALCEAEKVKAHNFDEKIPYFEGCLPVEVMAERGPLTLAYGPMKPVGLRDPRAGRRPFAVVQLRAEDQAESAWNIVGFQTRMTHDAQKRVFRTIPGLENASFLRMGSVHRNTFVDAPRVLDERLQLRAMPGVYFAGQITGVEGYVESSACGFLCGVFLAAELMGKPINRPPNTTALGGLLTHLAKQEPGFQPSNITWAQIPPLDTPAKKADRKERLAERALADLSRYSVELLG